MPFKSSLARSAGKPFGVFKERDLSLRGATQNSRFIPTAWESSRVAANSLRFDSGDSTYLSRLFSGVGNRRTWTLSYWLKTEGGGDAMFNCADSGLNTNIGFYTDQIKVYEYLNAYQWDIITDAKFRDPTAWEHIVIALDTNQSTAADRLKIYANGSLMSYSVNYTLARYYDTRWNTAVTHYVGGTGGPFDGYMAEVHFVDGLQLTPGDFAEADATEDLWVPKDCSGDLTYGTNGFYLKFDNTSDLGEDSSGNNNDFTANNFSTTAGAGNDVLADSPSTYPNGGNGVGNYCTLNPLDRQSTNGTLSNGNLDLTWSTSSWAMYRSTMHVSSGLWYWEVTLGNNQFSIFGIIPTEYDMDTSTNYWIAQVTGSYCFYPYNGKTYSGSEAGGIQYTSADTSASGVTYGMALDLDAGTLTYYKNGVSLGTAYTGISGSFSPAAGLYNQSGNDSYNFGQRAFDNLPAGYKALNTYNLDDTEILSGTYEGNGAADGPVVWMNATPATLKIGTSDPPTSLVTFSPTTVDPLAGGFKIRNSSTNNVDGTTYYWIATTNRAFKYANAQSNE